MIEKIYCSAIWYKELLEQRKYLLKEGQSVWQTDLLIDKHCK